MGRDSRGGRANECSVSFIAVAVYGASATRDDKFIVLRYTLPFNRFISNRKITKTEKKNHRLKHKRQTNYHTFASVTARPHDATILYYIRSQHRRHGTACDGV